MGSVKFLLIWKFSQCYLHLPYLAPSITGVGIKLFAQQHLARRRSSIQEKANPAILTSQGTKRQTYRRKEYYQVVAHTPSMLNCAIVIPTIVLVLPPSSSIEKNLPQIRLRSTTYRSCQELGCKSMTLNNRR